MSELEAQIDAMYERSDTALFDILHKLAEFVLQKDEEGLSQLPLLDVVD